MSSRCASAESGAGSSSGIAKQHPDIRDKPRANQTFGILSRICSLAKIWGLQPDRSNPCGHVKLDKESKRERFLSPW